MTPTAPLSPALSQQLSLTSAQSRPSLAHVHIVHWQHQTFGFVCQLLPKQTFLHWIFCQHLNFYVAENELYGSFGGRLHLFGHIPVQKCWCLVGLVAEVSTVLPARYVTCDVDV